MNRYAEALEGKLEALETSHRFQHQEAEPATRSLGTWERQELPHTPVFYWPKALADAVRQSAESLPGDTRLDAVPLPAVLDRPGAWFWFEQSFTYVAPPEAPYPGPVEVQAVWWSQMNDVTPNLTVFMLYGRAHGFLQFVATLYVKTARTLEQMIAAARPTAIEMDAQLVRFLVATLLWLGQDLLVSPAERAPRGLRRRLEKRDDAIPPEIKVIQLRPRRMVGVGGESADPVEWSCQWVVRGHWRQQYYAATKSHRPKWILPYVKGPEDKPLRSPKGEVFVVNR